MRNPLSHKLYLINIKLILAICYFALGKFMADLIGQDVQWLNKLMQKMGIKGSNPPKYRAGLGSIVTNVYQESRAEAWAFTVESSSLRMHQDGLTAPEKLLKDYGFSVSIDTTNGDIKETRSGIGYAPNQFARVDSYELKIDALESGFDGALQKLEYAVALQETIKRQASSNPPLDREGVISIFDEELAKLAAEKEQVYGNTTEIAARRAKERSDHSEFSWQREAEQKRLRGSGWGLGVMGGPLPRWR
jgi:hypothetical protein